MQGQLVRRWVVWASVLGALSVAAGAFGAHGLRSVLAPRDLEIYQTAVQYQALHALALLGVAFGASRWGGRLIHLAGLLLVLGVLVFSGSLYVLVLANLRWMGAITPLGGLAFMAGWLCLGAAAWREEGRARS